MVKAYVWQEHTHCMLNWSLFQNPDQGWEYPVEIILHLEDKIVVEISYAHETLPDMVDVTPYDGQGNKLIYIPTKYISQYYRWKEAEDICRCIDADAQLLSYAIG